MTALPEDSPIRTALWSTIVAPGRNAYTALLTGARDRGEIPAGAEPEMLLDQLAGALTYRALVNPAPLDEAQATTYVHQLLTSLGLLR